MDTENETSSVKFDGKGSKHDAFGILLTVKYSMRIALAIHCRGRKIMKCYN